MSEARWTRCRLLRVRFLGRLDNEVCAEVDVAAKDVSNGCKTR